MPAYSFDATSLSLPVIAAPLFLISNPELVLSCQRNGIIGTFPALNQRTSEGFEEWVQMIKKVNREESINVPFGVNLIVHKTNPRLQHDLGICAKNEVPLVITSLGAAKEVVEAVHGYGGKVFHDVTNLYHAKKAIDAGVDGLILVCAGAGGHAGTLNPFPFIKEVRKVFSGTIILAGAISDGYDIATALQCGADYAYMGTRFINTKESLVDPKYQEMIMDSGTGDIVHTAAVSGIPANFMKQSLLNAGLEPQMWSETKKIDLGKELDSEAKAWKSIWSAGHGVASIDDVVSVDQLVSTLKSQFREAFSVREDKMKTYL